MHFMYIFIHIDFIVLVGAPWANAALRHFTSRHNIVVTPEHLGLACANITTQTLCCDLCFSAWEILSLLPQ